MGFLRRLSLAAILKNKNMRKFIQTLVFIFLTFSTSAFCEKTPKLLLRYNYTLGKEYRYQKKTNSHNEHYLKTHNDEEFISFIQIKVLDSTQNGDFRLEYNLDSCVHFEVTKEPVMKSKKDLELSKVLVTYTRNGKELNRTYADGNERSFFKNSDYSENDRLFELPISFIDFDKSWNTSKAENGSYINKGWKNQNKLIGLEMKNGHNCYRIDFSGIIKNEGFQGDFRQVESGKIIGSYWIDNEKLIIVAVESEVTFNDISLVHPGAYGMKGITLMITPPHKTTFTLIE